MRKGGFSGGQFRGAEGFDFSEFMNAFGTSGRGRGGRSGRSGNFGAFEDILGDLFGGRMGGGGNYQTYTYGGAPYESSAGAGAQMEKVDTDLETKVKIPKAKLSPGGKIRIHKKDGETLSIELPKGIKDGQKIRLREQGKLCP